MEVSKDGKPVLSIRWSHTRHVTKDGEHTVIMPKGGDTIAVVDSIDLDGDNKPVAFTTFASGSSTCGLRDTFHKGEGRMRSLARALATIPNDFTEDMKQIKVLIVQQYAKEHAKSIKTSRYTIREMFADSLAEPENPKPYARS